jgi:hypothetical protein
MLEHAFRKKWIQEKTTRFLSKKEELRILLLIKRKYYFSFSYHANSNDTSSNKGSIVSLDRSWHDSRASYVIALSQGDVMTAGSEGTMCCKR